MNLNDVIEFFDSCAESWDEYLSPDIEKINEILAASQIKTGESVLDIACGTGVMFPYYLERGAESVTGIDISPKMLRKAEEKFKDNDKIRLFCADASAYAFKGTYDRCFVFNAFPHFDSPEVLLKNLYSALKNGGTLTVAHDSGRSEIDKHHENCAKDVSNGLMSEDKLEELLYSAGFTSVYKKANDGIYIVTGTKA